MLCHAVAVNLSFHFYNQSDCKRKRNCVFFNFLLTGSALPADFVITADVEDELPTPSVGKMLARCISYIPLIYMYIRKRSGYNEQHECSNMIFVLKSICNMVWVAVFTCTKSPFPCVLFSGFSHDRNCQSPNKALSQVHLALIFWAEKPHAIWLVNFVF